MHESEKALSAYENAVRNNPHSTTALLQIGGFYRNKEMFTKAAEIFQRILNQDPKNGAVWSQLGHIHLATDDLQKAYSAFQQALNTSARDAKLWYGIGVLYDRNGSLEYAEEAFTTVIRMEPNFEKNGEIYFRLGVMCKKMGKFDVAIQYLQYVLNNPPAPLTSMDILFQIGHVHETRKDYVQARECYEKILAESPNNPKVLQQLGWLYHSDGTGFTNQETAMTYLNKSIEADANDAQTWYVLGRCYMLQQNHSKAYESYHEAVKRDGSNPSFWCSIGVLYYQYHDALNAYTRAISLNPYISEIWYDLGTLYEACNNQIDDAIDAYSRALELEPNNVHIKDKLAVLKSGSNSSPLNVGPPSFYHGPQPKTQLKEGPRDDVPLGPPLTKELRRDDMNNRNVNATPNQGPRPTGSSVPYSASTYPNYQDLRKSNAGPISSGPISSGIPSQTQGSGIPMQGSTPQTGVRVAPNGQGYTPYSQEQMYRREQMQSQMHSSQAPIQQGQMHGQYDYQRGAASQQQRQMYEHQMNQRMMQQQQQQQGPMYRQ